MTTMKPSRSDCRCTSDPDLDELRRLVANGHDQLEASRLLWAPGTARVSPAVIVDHAGYEARRAARESFAAAFPWLRLPPTQEGRP